MENCITVTDGIKTIQVPFSEGEMTLAALKRVMRIPSPCAGRGICGMCIIDVVQKDGSLKKELACFLEAREMTVRLPYIHLIES